MAKFCGNCGRALQEGEVCSCQPVAVASAAVGAGIGDPKVFFASLWKTILDFIKNPIGVICENAEGKNWLAASLIILVAAIFQGLAKISFYSRDVYDFMPKENGTWFFKTFFMEVLLMGSLALALFAFGKVFNKSNSDLLKTYTAVGIAAIPYAAASIVVFILNFFTYDLTSTVTYFAQAFAVFAVLFALKNIDRIKKEETMIYIASFSVAAYFLMDLILVKIIW